AYGNQVLDYINEIEQQATKASPEGAKRIDFAGLKAAADAFAKAGTAARTQAEALLARPSASDHSAGGSTSDAELARINRALGMAGRDLTEPGGRPDRPWEPPLPYPPPPSHRYCA